MDHIMEHSSLAYSFNIEEISQFEHIIFSSCPKIMHYFRLVTGGLGIN